MRRFLYGCRPLNNHGLFWLVTKISLFLLLLYSLFYVVRYGHLTHNLNIRPRTLSNNEITSNWHCELNKRLLKELQKEIHEQNKLLNYRGKVISKLRTQLKELNKTNMNLKQTLSNLTEIIISKRESSEILEKRGNETLDYYHGNGSSLEFHNQTSSYYLKDTPHSFSNYLDSVKSKVDTVARPCCIALKRMTDILRLYMEEAKDLKDQVAAYERLNITERMYEFAEKEKRKFAALNCSQQFLLETQNLTKKSEKHALFQLYSHGYFYETTPLNRERPKQKFKSRSYHRNVDFAKAVNIGLQEVLRHSKLSRDYFEMNDGLLHYDEIRGAQYKLVFTYNKTRTFLVDVLKPYGPHIVPENIAEQTIKQHELINIIVPLTKFTNRLDLFLENIRQVIDDKRQNIYLTVVIYGTDVNNEIKSRIKTFSAKYGFRNYDILKKNRPFSRGRALHDGITRWNGYENVLMFLCDIDIKFNYEFLNRCRLNTKLGSTVYMPIVYSLYNPTRVFEGRTNITEAEQFNITDETGTWRPLGYGMLCFYRPDYIKARGFNLKITGWGGEDVSLYHRFLKKGFKVIRATDPDLFHIWHEKSCNRSLLTKRQYITCIGSKARYEASQRHLGITLLS